MRRWAALLALLSGCTFARIRYHEGAATSPALQCFPSEAEALECWPYFKVKGRASRSEI